MTYPFGGLEQLLREAFGRFAERIVALFDSYLAAPQMESRLGRR